MRIRGARPDDAEALAAMWNVMIRETLFTFTTEEKSPGGIAAMIKDRPGAFWVADAPEPVGFVTYGQFRAGPGYAASRHDGGDQWHQSRRGGVSQRVGIFAGWTVARGRSKTRPMDRFNFDAENAERALTS